MDRITAAKVFVDVAYSGSFTATADRLDMSRPMVTRYIEAMENWLQTRLLNRTTRKVSLTSAGETCLADVERLLEKADELTLLTTANDELTGTIRLATSMSFGYAQLVPALKGFMLAHPSVVIDVDLEDSTTDLTRERIDLALRIASDPDPSLIGKPIAPCESVLVASPGYLDKSSEIKHPRDLEVHECLGYKNFERHVWHLHKDADIESIDISCHLTANDATLLTQAAIAHLGIAMQPKYLVAKHLQSGELVEVLPSWKPKDMQVYVLYSSRKNMPPAVRALIDHLSDYFSAQHW
ncbi:LysR family transcriptional regulator [Enterovibrio norvegicus]|uniref:LysR family transcriptional regulator n=1 Tax=Enterovibrio norvegicus TaxID=188144 RepID=A0ABV4KZY2_9GAMM|nr:LysR family transcriptional regulator [Enterovibrio norvegicus]